MRPPRQPDTARDAVGDLGLQRERTALAWTRTGLALMVAGALHVRVAAGSVAQVPGFLAIVGGAAILLQAYRRYARQHAASPTSANPSPTQPRLVRAVGLGVCLLSASAVVVVLSRL